MESNFKYKNKEIRFAVLVIEIVILMTAAALYMGSKGIKEEEVFYDDSIQSNDLESDTTKSYVGKRVSILGDSISTLEGYLPEGNRYTYVTSENSDREQFLHVSFDETWWGSVINDTGMNLGINESWSGSKVSNLNTSNTWNDGPDVCMASMTRIKRLGDNGVPDVILFYGGTNDILKNVTLGNFDANASYVTELDISSTRYSNFVEAYTIAIKRMKYLYPNAEIISILPTFTDSYDSDKDLDVYNAEIKKICDYFDIKYVDLTECGITLNELGDGIHPTSNGMKLMSDYIVECISIL